MHWSVVAPFIYENDLSSSCWLHSHVPGKRHQFHIVPRRKPLANWHDRNSPLTTKEEWLEYWHHATKAFKLQQGGIITVFPQLASVVGLRQRFSHKHIPIVAWLFNVGTCHPHFRRWLAQVSLKDIDRFVVHTRRERDIYSRWLELPLERFEFVPIQRAEIPTTYEEEHDEPFVLALGSAHRDFPTLFEAVKKLNLRTIVVSGPRALQGLTIPPQVETPFGLSKDDCLRLAQQARVNVVPMLQNEWITAAGQITITEAMRMNRPVIASNCNGAEDYIKNNETGLLVEPNSVDDLTQAIDKLWNEQELRQKLGTEAGRYAAMHYSDEAIGVALGQILDSVADKAGFN